MVFSVHSLLAILALLPEVLGVQDCTGFFRCFVFGPPETVRPAFLSVRLVRPVPSLVKA